MAIAQILINIIPYRVLIKLESLCNKYSNTKKNVEYMSKLPKCPLAKRPHSKLNHYLSKTSPIVSNFL